MTETRGRQNIDVSCFHNSLGLILVTSRSSGPRTHAVRTYAEKLLFRLLFIFYSDSSILDDRFHATQRTMA